MASTVSAVNDYQHIDVKPLSGVLGAEIGGLDLREHLPAEVVAEVRAAFLEHLVIFFRDQSLDPQQFVRFAARFGAIDAHHVLRGMDEAPEVLEIIREPTDQYVFAPGWHADVTWQTRPAMGALLYGVEVPEVGGDTVFANQYLAYDALSSGMQALLGRLDAVHSAAATYGDRAEVMTKPELMKVDREQAVKGRSVHPVVRTHPETGRKSLFVHCGYTVSFDGMTVAESKPLLDFLFDHTTRPEFTTRFRWRPGSIAFWDNRCSLHAPVDDYFGKRRRTWRVTLRGDVPR